MVSAVAGLAVPSASASRNMLVGIYDEPSTIGRPDWAFPKYKALRVKVLRVNLYWGDVLGVAKNRRPANPTNPADPAYDWFFYDRTVNQAKANGIQMVFSILWTPRWAGPRKNGAPTRMADLRNFAIAAAKRYTGSYTPIPDAKPLPSVKLLDGLERAEQPGLPLAAVQEGRKSLPRRRARASTRRCATRSTRASRPCEPPTRSRAASLLREGTTAHAARGRRSPRSTSPRG